MNSGRRGQRRPGAREDYEAMAAKLNDIANRSTAKATWRQQVLAMGPEGKTVDQQLAAWRAMRDAGAVTKAEALFASFSLLETRATDRAMKDPGLVAISEQMKAVERDHDLPDDWEFLPGEEPEEYKALQAKWEARERRLVADYLREYGETQTADLYLNDNLAFRRVYEAGRQSLFGTLQERIASDGEDWQQEAVTRMETALKNMGVIDDQGRPVPVPGFED